MTTSKELFLDSADSRNTSSELMDAIFLVAGKSDSEAVRVWEDPTEPETLAIWEIVTKNGLIPSSQFIWGAAGREWATCEKKKFKVGYYQADLINGVTYIGDALEDDSTEVSSPIFFQKHLSDSDFDGMVTFLDESSEGIFSEIDEEYGIK